MFGTIVLYKFDRGFGFIRRAEVPADLFFHFRECSGNEALLCAGTMVEFTLGEHKGKAVARDVRLLGTTDEECAVSEGGAA